MSLFEPSDMSFNSLPKILCLHGGGQSASGFQSQILDINRALNNSFQLYFPEAPNYLWVTDPPLGKENPTTDLSPAEQSLEYLNNYIDKNGPFRGILGYSQGAMFTTYYLSTIPKNKFTFAVMFCGYLPITHQGLLDNIISQSPYTIPSLIFMGIYDSIISNDLTNEKASYFSNNIVIESQEYHRPPDSYNPDFDTVIRFMEGYK